MTAQSNEEMIERIEAAMKDKDQLHHVKLKEDKEAVELEEAAITHAGYVFQQVRGFVPDEFTWKDAQCGKELGAYGAAFLLGVEFQKQREKPVIGEDLED